METRIFGNETEYAVLKFEKDLEGDSRWAPIKDGSQMSPLFEAMPDAIHCSNKINLWGASGYRFYQDTGAHPEYATPECISPKQLALYTVAGNRILTETLNQINPITIDKLKYRILLGCTNCAPSADGGGTVSYGNHLNISFSAYKGACHDRLAITVAPFFATAMTTWDGTLRFAIERKKKVRRVVFEVSQRMAHIRFLTSNSTTENRGVVNLRKEHHSDTDAHRRLHIIGPDTHRSEYSIWLRAATAALVVGMAEDASFSLPVLMTDNTFQNGKYRANRDFSGKQEVWSVARKRMSSLRIQRYYLSQAKEYYAGDSEAKEIIEEWERVLRLYNEDIWSLVGEVEWVTKWKFLSDYAQKSLGKTDWVTVAQKRPYRFAFSSLLYSMLNEFSVYEQCEQDYDIRRMFTDEEVAEAMIKPPAETRAISRGSLIKEALNNCIHIHNIDWEKADFDRKRPDGTHVRRKGAFKGLPNNT